MSDLTIMHPSVDIIIISNSYPRLYWEYAFLSTVKFYSHILFKIRNMCLYRMHSFLS